MAQSIGWYESRVALEQIGWYEDRPHLASPHEIGWYETTADLEIDWYVRLPSETIGYGETDV